MGDPFHDKESEQFVAHNIERTPLSLEKLSIQDNIATYSTKDDAAHEFDALEFLAALSVRIPKTYESIIDPLECPKCKGYMRIIVFIQDAHSIKDIMKSQGSPDFQAPPPIPKFIDTAQAIDKLTSYESVDPSPDEF